MSILNFFDKRPSVEDGVAEYRAASDALLLDVRTTAEYAGGHIPGSVNLPLDRIAGISVDKAKPLFVYCHSGARSAQACSWLNRQGYEAKNIGGIMTYRGNIER